MKENIFLHRNSVEEILYGGSARNYGDFNGKFIIFCDAQMNAMSFNVLKPKVLRGKNVIYNTIYIDKKYRTDDELTNASQDR